ncbi:AbiTii domain-containing protein [Marinobacter sp. OP 3.4]|uniref:AbiTii domain-containing protein n=1 Tax=Marinobacter sp. OP 3.4 TaxID=3076501 RepID=UPI002E204224
MSAPVDHLQERVVDASEHLADIMPSAITLAMMLRHRNIATWLRAEFEGYDTTAELPAYRHDVNGHIVARSPQYGWIPAPIDQQQVRQFGHLDLRDDITNLEQTCLNCKKGNGHRIALPGDQLLDLQQKINLSAELAINISRSTYCEVLKTIRGSLYLWTRAILDAGLTGDHNTFTREEKEKVACLDNPVRFWREAMDSLESLPVPNVREAGFLERMFGRAG